MSQQKVATRTGTSTHFKTQDSAGNYRFGYDVVHSSGSSFHKEQSSNGVKVGSYGLRDVDGRVRVVNYVADAQGFRADVRTNEPGVEPMKDPAGATINRPPPVAPLPPVSFTVDHAVELAGGGEPSDEPCEEDISDEAAAETTPQAEATSEAATPAQVPNSPQVASTSQQVPESSVSSTAAPSVIPPVAPSVGLKPVVTPLKPSASTEHVAKQEEPKNSSASQTQSGGDVPPPELAPEATPKPPPRRRPKPRPSVFPPPVKPTAAPAATKTTTDPGAPKRASTGPKRKVHRQGYPYYVRQEDVHIVGVRPPVRPYRTRPFGYPGGIPHPVAPFRPFHQPAFARAQPPSPPFGPSYFRYPGFPPQLAFQGPRQWPLHPALYGNPGLTNPFSLLPGFPVRQLKWPYHVHAAQAPFDFLSPLLAFQL